MHSTYIVDSQMLIFLITFNWKVILHVVYLNRYNKESLKRIPCELSLSLLRFSHLNTG